MPPRTPCFDCGERLRQIRVIGRPLMVGRHIVEITADKPTGDFPEDNRQAVTTSVFEPAFQLGFCCLFRLVLFPCFARRPFRTGLDGKDAPTAMMIFERILQKWIRHSPTFPNHSGYFRISSHLDRSGAPAASQSRNSSKFQRTARPKRIGRGRRPLEFSDQRWRVEMPSSLATSSAVRAKRSVSVACDVLLMHALWTGFLAQQEADRGFES